MEIAGKKWKRVYRFFLAIPIQGRCNLPLPIYIKKRHPEGCLRVECGARTHETQNLNSQNVTC